LKIVPQSEARELLYQQSQAIESMTRLLNALLDISRLESGAIEPVSVDVPLAEIFEELRSEFSSIATSRNIDLHVQLPPFVVSTDRILFYQLLQNLLGNALKYTDRGWVRLQCSHDAHGITIAVEDSGIGIPADKLERIFDEYYQVDTHGTKRMGVGLGLAIVKEVARLLGFSVKIFSKVGDGTQVILHIPGRYAVTRAATKVEPARVHVLDPHARKARLILVEDNDGVRIATELFLKLEGHETRSAATLAEAEVLLERLQPGDVVIADYHLDQRNTGLDMLTRLRERLGYDVPGVILSGDLPSLVRSLRTPVASCRFLSKPVDTAALMEAIAELSAASRDQGRGAAS
jgi:two-component system, sensor histidine kinase